MVYCILCDIKVMMMMMMKTMFISAGICMCTTILLFTNSSYQIFVLTTGTVTLEVILFHQHPPSLSCGIQLINITDEDLQDTLTRHQDPYKNGLKKK